jgi:hypothetical protein
LFTIAPLAKERFVNPLKIYCLVSTNPISIPNITLVRNLFNPPPRPKLKYSPFGNCNILKRTSDNTAEITRYKNMPKDRNNEEVSRLNFFIRQNDETRKINVKRTNITRAMVAPSVTSVKIL